MAKFLLIGPGAIGTIVAAHAAAAGHEGWVACRTQSTANRIGRDGLKATTPRGKLVEAKVHAVVEPKPLNVDVVILGTKCRSAVDAWRKWAPHVPEQATVLALQNGVMGDELHPMALGRLVMGTVAYPARLEGVGTSRQLAPGGYHIGPWPAGPSDELVDKAATVLRPSGKVNVSSDMEGVQWTKLLVNSAMTGLGILTGEPVGTVLGDKRAREAVFSMMAEGLAAGEAAGVRFARLQGFHPAMLATGRSWFPPGIRHGLLRMYGNKYGEHTSSSMPDLQRGQPTEIPYLNGHVVATGRENDVETPVHEALVSTVKSIESGAEAPSMRLLDRLE